MENSSHPIIPLPSGGTRARGFIWYFALLAGALLTYRIGIILSRLYFHPLAKYPGPWSYAVSNLPYLFSEKVQGTFYKKAAALHDRYGSIVRIAPNRLAIDPAIAWKEIFAHRPPSRGEFYKDKKHFRNPDSLIAAFTDDHRRQRRQLAQAFSEVAMYQQEVYIKRYIDLLIDQLGPMTKEGKPIDMVKWFNFTSFDIIGELTFAESFDCLAKGEYHPWITVIFTSIKSAANLQFIMQYPLLKPLVWYMVGRKGLERGRLHREAARERAERRIALGPADERKDFMTYVLRDNDETGKTGMTHDEMIQNTGLLMGAGSETTAGALSGLSFYLTRSPHAYDRLTKEVRSAFKTEDEINMRAVAKLQYLQACIEEGLRLYSPVPDMSPRISPGDTVAGHYIPPSTLVCVYGWAAYHSKKNFVEADAFLPERWLPSEHPFYEEARFANDNKPIFKPFSYGPRDCIGRNIAYAEMRLIMSRLLWNFDLKLVEGYENWHEKQRNFFILEKGPLLMKLKPVGAGS